MQQAADFVRRGRYVALSPEGARSWDGKVLPMKTSTFALPIEARRPIVPMVIYGTHEALPRGRFAIRPGLIEVEFLPPVSVEGYEDRCRELKTTVTSAFRAALAEGPPSRRTVASY
jgi:1-acyl-sn-glycerol-3-phosphate acyltransferase